MGLISSTNLIPLLQALVPILLCFSLDLYSATDTITTTQAIKDPETIVSKSKIFKLGFFSPFNSSNRYVGIWYNAISVTTVIWVANRDRPLNDSFGTLKISDDGNLLVLNGQKEIFWSSNASKSQMISIAQLSDSGNLVLRENLTGTKIWDSFGHPSDSVLSKMKLSTNANTGEKIKLTSWRSPSDPSIGSFSLSVDPLNIPQVLIWNGTRPYWRSGPWNGRVFIGVQAMYSVYLDGFNVVDDKEGNVLVTLNYANESFLSRFVLHSNGTLEQTYWDHGKENWEFIWSAPETKCDVYGECGPFGSCNSHDLPICTCLRGFGPANMEEWSRGNWTSGCARKAPLQCQRNNSRAEHGKEDGFLKLKTMKVPDFAKWSSVLEDNCENQCLNYCENQCLNNCSCIAYAYDAGIGCMQWNGNLIDVQKFSTDGVDLYIRVSYLELDKKRNTKVIIAITVMIGSLTIAICTYFSWRRMCKQTGRKEEGNVFLFDRGDTYPNYSNERMLGDNMSQDKLEELPLFNFQKLAIATNNFDIGNKLGQGGFGPVYRGSVEEDDGWIVSVVHDEETNVSQVSAFLAAVSLLCPSHNLCKYGIQKFLFVDRELAKAGGTIGTQNNLGLDFMMNMFGGLRAGSLIVPNMPDGYNSFTPPL
ncbi:hypothetical protein F0562_014169 [Nyssa sinensis]|uniref:Non-specific serine/threonine protein kinase n=1 Tax=Nyssa sinensis TaxID=561372 RepID=A0A5J4ZS82_9ASTE|nr:hypothetical protein F0562_014169 [Nyssa sinensis]